MIKDKSDHDIRGTTRGIAPAWGRSSRTAPGSPPAAERGSWSRVLLKHWSWILLMTAAVTAGAVALSEMQTPIYKAQAVVAVYPPSWAGSAVPIVLGTEKGIISSGAVLSIASQSLLISESTLQRGLSISIPVDTDLLVISFSDPAPQRAQTVGEGIPQAYVTYRSWKAPPVATGNTSATPSTAEAVQ